MQNKIEDFKYYNYPNPRLRRENYVLLNGIWDFEFSNSLDFKNKRQIMVPFAYEAKESLIGETEAHKYLHYHKDFNIDELGDYLLHFEGVDYKCKIYINKVYAYKHIGGYTSFYFNIKKYIKKGTNTIDVLVEDTFSKEQLRGKQRARNENYYCWYTQYSGIYKDVYLEKCGSHYVKKLKVRGNKNGIINYSFRLDKKSDCEIDIYFDSKLIKSVKLEKGLAFHGEIKLDEFKIYDKDNINLYDFVVKTKDDTLSTYFGFISVETKDQKIYINDKETYLKMILNQGYYKDKLVSGTKEDVLKDLLLIKEIGFNGIRVHQKQESNFFYYVTDCLGLYLWSEIPSCYEYSDKMKKEYKRDLVRIINQNYNSPSIITYVLFNESWGIPEINTSKECQSFVNNMKELTLKNDISRLVVCNDGWFNLEKSDLCCLHEYDQDSSKFKETYKNKEYILKDHIINEYGKAYASLNKYNNQPIIISEFGGASLKTSSGWGYGEKIDNIASYKKQLEDIFDCIYSLDYISGYCYTQLTDVEQETNGIVDENRNLKINIDDLKRIIGGKK